jgi:predicted enzyme related to lactoylglutathione lyase
MNPVVHFEMPYHDRQRAVDFYARAFDWQAQILGESMGNYVLLTTAIADARPGAPAGAINGGMFPFKPDWPGQHPSLVIGVQDIQVAMERVIQAGGEVLGQPMTIPGVGQYVAFHDTEGNRNSMMQPLTMG